MYFFLDSNIYLWKWMINIRSTTFGFQLPSNLESCRSLIWLIAGITTWGSAAMTGLIDNDQWANLFLLETESILLWHSSNCTYRKSEIEWSIQISMVLTNVVNCNSETKLSIAKMHTKVVICNSCIQKISHLWRNFAIFTLGEPL